jgi:uncharacterized damage-inducible protein DinB
MSEPLIKKYHQIETIKKRYLSQVANLPEEQFNQAPEDGSWSIAQVLYHLYLAENGTIRAVQKNLRENNVKAHSKISDMFRNMLLVLFLKSPLKFKAPSILGSMPDHIKREEINKLFGEATDSFKEVLNGLPKQLENKRIFKHPVSGKFNIGQTLNFVREHYLHHQGQLNKLLA